MRFSIVTLAIRRFLIYAFALSSLGCASVAHAGNHLEMVVRNLYAQRGNDVPVQEASIAVLEKYFRPDLARALVQDRKCVEASKEICRIDFHVLFDSQDPDFKAPLVIERTLSPGKVRACFGSTTVDRRCISYLGRRFAGQVRVADVIYASGGSLRAILGLPPLEQSRVSVAP